MACPVCGAAHATCGGPAVLLAPVLDFKRSLINMPSNVLAIADVYITAAGEVVGANSPAKQTKIASARSPVPTAYLGAYQAWLATLEEAQADAAKAELAPRLNKARAPQQNK